MAIATLDAILQKTRRLIASPNTLQISDDDLNDYINSFYLYDFPAQFRSLQLKDVYTFDTQQGIDVYAFDSEHYLTVQMPAYCAKREIKLFNDPWGFWATNYNWQTLENFAYGNGTQGPYTGTLSAIPIIRSVNTSSNTSVNPNFPAYKVQNLLITANLNPPMPQAKMTLNVTDDGAGNLIGDIGSIVNSTINTINYENGQVSVYFNQNIPDGQPIQAQYNPTTESIPLSIMFYQNQFTLRPVPDQGYTIEITAYRQPSQALQNVPLNQGTPDLSEWWEALAIGAAKKFYEDSLDTDGIALMDKMLREKYALVETRTYAQIGTQRVSTIFADQLTNNYGQSAGWFGSV